MPGQFLYKLIYALVSGFTVLLPVSARPHQILYETLTGVTMTDPMVSFCVHLGGLLAVWSACAGHIRRLLRENRVRRVSRRRRRQRSSDRIALLDIQIIKTAAFPIIASLFLYPYLQKKIHTLAFLSLTLIINGIILILPDYAYRGNKDGRSFSRLDSMCLGLGGALGAIPGLSHMGGMLSVGLLRGADGSYVLNIAYLLSIPLLLGLSVLDLYAGIQASGSPGFLAILGYGIMTAAAFGAAYLCIIFTRYLFSKANNTSFCYYSFGLAMFSFILYLMT